MYNSTKMITNCIQIFMFIQAKYNFFKYVLFQNYSNKRYVYTGSRKSGTTENKGIPYAKKYFLYYETLLSRKLFLNIC